MTASDRRKVEQVAEMIRAELGSDPEDVRAMCFDATKALGSALKAAGFKPTRVQGTFSVDEPDPEVTPAEAFESGEAYTPIHHWIELGGLIVDVTASQFNDEIEDPMPDIVIGKTRDLRRYRAIKKVVVRR